jgi:hypothetical protein
MDNQDGLGENARQTYVVACLSESQEEATCQNARVTLRRCLTHGYNSPCKHDPAHPYIGLEALQQKC